MKAAGKDILNPVFEESTSVEAEVPVPVAAAPEVCMTNPEIKRQITLEELKGQDRNKPWVGSINVRIR